MPKVPEYVRNAQEPLLRDHVATTFVRHMLTPDRQQTILAGASNRLIRAVVRAAFNVTDIYLEERGTDRHLDGDERTVVSEIIAELASNVDGSPDPDTLRGVVNKLQRLEGKT